ncbi:ABC transporter permease [Nitrolancea hollandica]|uniref:Transport permease protein n=1 Tax=Nitrolancea hollandica Lb TaxID=1129897 RepID=I4EEQ1_9BACT|nr:ABC transporter permease [Nitrolancea hollandica]CCF83163.1 ABC-2 type transporter [Nitrolancea hollandica Lb]
MRVDSEIPIFWREPAESEPEDSGLPISEHPTLVIKPTRGWAALNLRDLWHYRELLYFMTWRDVKVRYKQTAIGAVWAVLQPFLTMVVFSIIFGRLAKVPSDGVPYPVFSFSALLPWTFFATAITQAGTSLVTNINLVSKVYFPRLIVPTAGVLVGIVDFAVAFVVLLGMMLVYGIVPGIAVLTLPLFLLLAFMTALGISLWLSALNVKYRDIRFTIPFLTQFWLFVTPVAYSSSMIPEKWRLLYGLNPMAGVVEGFRWALLGSEQAPGGMILVSAAVVIVLFVGGLFYFRRMEREFADVI